jgi:hypothetical protein
MTLGRAGPTPVLLRLERPAPGLSATRKWEPGQKSLDGRLGFSNVGEGARVGNLSFRDVGSAQERNGPGGQWEPGPRTLDGRLSFRDAGEGSRVGTASFRDAGSAPGRDGAVRQWAPDSSTLDGRLSFRGGELGGAALWAGGAPGPGRDGIPMAHDYDLSDRSRPSVRDLGPEPRWDGGAGDRFGGVGRGAALIVPSNVLPF